MRDIPEIKKDFIKTIESLSRTRHKWQAWSDFVEVAAISLAQFGNFDEERGTSYMRIVDKYEPKEVQLFPKLLWMVTEALEVRHCDFLGEVFMELELGNKFKGQVFTPFPLCSLMTRMTFKKELFENGNVVTMNEPAVGGGAMVIAMCDHLMNERINFQKQLKITCQDVDYTAVCMCYIQLSLIGCNAVVVHANTLSMEEWGSFYTPMALMYPIRSTHVLSTHVLQPATEMIAELPLQRTLTEFV